MESQADALTKTEASSVLHQHTMQSSLELHPNSLAKWPENNSKKITGSKKRATVIPQYEVALACFLLNDFSYTLNTFKLSVCSTIVYLSFL